MEKNIKKLLEKVNEINRKIDDKYQLNENLGLNIFEYISDKYYYENFHSDILQAILCYDTEILHDFLKLIDKDIDINKYKDTEIIREEKYVDISIKGNGHAVIIENKINDAVDQPRQLIKYIEEIETDYQIDAVIYLSFDGEKTPDYSSYYDENSPKKSREDVEKTKDLISLLAYFNNNKKETIYKWLTKEKERLKENEDITSFIYQYLKLLNHINEHKMKEKERQEKIIEQIIENEETYNSFIELKNIKEKDIRIYLLKKFGNNLKKRLFNKNKNIEIEFNEIYLANSRTFDFGISKKEKKYALYLYSEFDTNANEEKLKFNYMFYGIAPRWDTQETLPNIENIKEVLGSPETDKIDYIQDKDAWNWVSEFKAYQDISWTDLDKDNDTTNSLVDKVYDIFKKVEDIL